MSPRQVYSCPDHGEFEVEIRVRVSVPEIQPCPFTEADPERGEGFSRFCIRQCPWVPSVPNFIGGPTTGAQKGK